MNLLDLRLHRLEGPWRFTSPSKPTALSNEVQKKDIGVYANSRFPSIFRHFAYTPVARRPENFELILRGRGLSGSDCRGRPEAWQ